MLLGRAELWLPRRPTGRFQVALAVSRRHLSVASQCYLSVAAGVVLLDWTSFHECVSRTCLREREMTNTARNIGLEVLRA